MVIILIQYTKNGVVFLKKMPRSIIKKKTSQILLSEYNQSFYKQNDFEKVKWSSRESMVNRYRLFFNTIKKKKFNRWLDVGSGTGSIFKYHDKLKNNNISYRLGIEINKNLYNYSKKKSYKKKVLFKNKDIYSYNPKLKFDLISLIGVLQNCGHNPFRIVKKTICLLSRGGFLFLTTKNLLWNKFSKNIKPCNDHSWFIPSDIENILKRLNINIICMLGFNPKSNKVVSLKKSHTIFIFGKKND